LLSGAAADGTTIQAVDGQLSTNGFGVLSGNEDVNAGGTLLSGSLSGSVAIGVNGRGTGPISLLSLNSPPTYVFYFVSADRFVLLSTSPSPNPVLSGIAERQCSDCIF
jgi:hypothetical protein